MLFRLVLLGGVFGPRLVTGAMIRLNHKRQSHPGDLELKHLVLAVQLSFAALAVLTTRPACHPSLASCLSSHKESLPSVSDAYGQSLKALPSQPTASGSESHVPGAVSE
ncbi:hypothetical protein Tco_0020714 [Tanacetum coccineum]